jgi:hypothetical protein
LNFLEGNNGNLVAEPALHAPGPRQKPPSALAGTRLIATMLFGLSPSDPFTIATVSLLLLLVALFAGYLPARRASKIDPIVVLRSE